MLIPNVVGPCPRIPSSQEQPPEPGGGYSCSSPTSLSSKGQQHLPTHALIPAIVRFLFYFLLQACNQSEQTAGSQLAPKSGAVASLGL